MNELHELFKERVREQRHNMRRRRSRTRRKWIIGWCLILFGAPRHQLIKIELIRIWDDPSPVQGRENVSNNVTDVAGAADRLT